LCFVSGAGVRNPVWAFASLGAASFIVINQ